MVTINAIRNALRPPPAAKSPHIADAERARLLEQQPALLARLDTFVAPPATSPTIPLGTGRPMRASNEFQSPHVKSWPFDSRLWPVTTSQVLTGITAGSGESLAGNPTIATPQPAAGGPSAVPRPQGEASAQVGEDAQYQADEYDDQRGTEARRHNAVATVASETVVRAPTLNTPVRHATVREATDRHATIGDAAVPESAFEDQAAVDACLANAAPVEAAVMDVAVGDVADQIDADVDDQSLEQRPEQRAEQDLEERAVHGRVKTAGADTVTRLERRSPAKADSDGAVEVAPPSLARPRQATIYAVTAHKGGVGKTTTTINLGAWLGQLGFRTLLVDLDPQGNVAKGLGLMPPPGALYKVLRDPSVPMDSAIVPTELPNVDLLPADTGLEGAEIEMIHAVSRETVLRRKIKAAGLRERYDCILLDCRPSLGVLTVNAMVAADRLIIPVETHFFALEALQTLLEVFETVQENLNPQLEIGGIVPTLHEPRVRVCQATLEMLRERYPEWLTQTVIRKYVAYPEAQMRGQPISVLAPGTDAAECYRALAVELHGKSQSEQATFAARREGLNQQLAESAA